MILVDVYFVVAAIATGPLAVVSSLRDVNIDMTRETVEFSVTSGMKIQNRTLGATADTTEDESAMTVTNSPVSGFKYYGYGNGPILRFQDLAIATTNYSLCDASTGVISFDYSVLPAAGSQNDFKRPPITRAFMRAKGRQRCTILPGNIYESIFDWNRKMSVNTFFSKFKDALINANVADASFTLGQFEFIGVDRTVGAGSATISLGYEMSQTYRCKLTTRSSTTNAFRVFH